MKTTKFTRLERQFLVLSQDYKLGANDLAQVYGIPRRKARRVLQRAEAKDTLACERLLQAIFPEGTRR